MPCLVRPRRPCARRSRRRSITNPTCSMIVALLRPGHDGWSAEDWQAFFDERAGIMEFDGRLSRTEAEAQALACCIVEWLNRNPTPSAPGRCVWCGQAESRHAAVLPY